MLILFRKTFITLALFTLITGFVMANDGVTVQDWHGFNVSGEGDYGTPGNPTGTLYESYTDTTGTYADVLKLEPPPGGYTPGSIAMSYTVPNDGNYRLSMWVWADKLKDQQIYIEFEHIGGDWESITGSVNEPADFQDGQWLYVTIDSKKYPDGVFLKAGEKFGLLTQTGDWKPGVGLNGFTIYIRDLKLDLVTEIDKHDTGSENSYENNGKPAEDWHGFNISGKDDFGTPGNSVGTLYESYTDTTGTYTDVLKLEPPPGGYESGSLAMTYAVPNDGNYRLSMWVWVDKSKDQQVYIEFEHIGGDWESVTGSVNEPAAFQDGQWLYVTTDPKKYPAGVFLKAGEKFGLLTQNHDGIGLNNRTIYLRNLKLELVTGTKSFSSILKGLYAGLELGIDNINKPNGWRRKPFLYSTLGYSNSFFRDAMHFYSELGINTGLYDVKNANDENTLPVDLYLDSYWDYGLALGSSTLTFIMEDKIDPPLVINPMLNSGMLNMYNKFTPGMKLSHWIENIGSFYAQAGFPIYYSYYWHDNTDSSFYFQGKLGWYSQFGLGIWVREDWVMAGDKWKWAEPGHYAINFGFSYWTRPFNTSVEVDIPRLRYGDVYIDIESNVGSFLNLKIEAYIPQEEIQNKGIYLILTPKFQYTIFTGFSVWTKFIIEAAGSKTYNTSFSPSVGFTYHF